MHKYGMPYFPLSLVGLLEPSVIWVRYGHLVCYGPDLSPSHQLSAALLCLHQMRIPKGSTRRR
uniref:Uncharacterized protein n=1 Tax=Rhizophora mucronata TaxID=61149 RepID=A0A2P2R175_RHIMU